MPFATLVYNVPAAAAGASNVDLTAATDSDFSQRNSHYIFTEHYRLVGAAAVGVSVTRGRYQVPTFNAIGEFTIFNANRALQPPAQPQWDSYMEYPPDVPMNEEFQVQLSNNLGAATEIENVVLQLITDDWSANLPRSGNVPPIIQVRTSFAVTPTLNAWSGPQALTFSQSLRGGVYAVCGAVCQGTNSVAFRLVFPRTKLYNGRKLRPGGLIQTAIGDALSDSFGHKIFQFGEYGQFHTFEPVQCEVFGTAAAATTYQLFLWLVWLGSRASLYGHNL